jgi:gephyrin
MALRFRNVQARVGILTVSDRGAAGVYEDKAGPVIRRIVEDELGGLVVESTIVSDELEVIKDTLLAWVDQKQLDLVFTTGGTGFAQRDVTPEATRRVLEKEAPGLVFAMLRDSLEITPHAMLSRMVAGIRNRTLIVNLPGSPKAVKENLTSILPALPHAVQLLQDDPAAEQSH